MSKASFIEATTFLNIDLNINEIRHRIKGKDMKILETRIISTVSNIKNASHVLSCGILHL